MAHRIENKLEELGLILPDLSLVAGNYVTSVVAGQMLFVSGQLPIDNGVVAYTGHLGRDITDDDGYKAAKLCGLNILSQVRAALHGNWGRLQRCVQLSVFVQSMPDFYNQPAIANGASDLMVQVLGAEIGKHTRAAVGVPSLPKNSAVEVAAQFWLEE